MVAGHAAAGMSGQQRGIAGIARGAAVPVDGDMQSSADRSGRPDGLNSPPFADEECDIVIAEDEESFRVLLKVFLEATGYFVRAFPNGAEALAYVRLHRVGVLVTDIFMPGSDGFELLRALRRDRREMRVVAMSGTEIIDIRLIGQIARCFGATRVLVKPFGLAELLEAVRAEIGDPPSASPAEGTPQRE